MQQLVQPNFNASGQVGYCLAYAEDFFQAPHVEPTAWDAWNATQLKHEDSNLPDAIVPMWYSYTLNGVNYGHVTAWVPGQGIYSSPWKRGTTHAVLPSIAEVERIYGCKFVGWSEDISTLRIVEDIMKPSYKDVLDAFNQYDIGPLSADQQNYYVARGVDVLWLDLLKFTFDRRKELESQVNQLQTQINDLQKKVDDLTSANLKLTDQITALKAKPVVQPDPTVTVSQSGLWAAFKRILGL